MTTSECIGQVYFTAGEEEGGEDGLCANAAPVAQIVTKIDNIRILVLKLEIG